MSSAQAVGPELFLPRSEVRGPADLIAFKLRDLRAGLDDKSSLSAPLQRKNLEFLIRYYENGGSIPVGDQVMWILDGNANQEGRWDGSFTVVCGGRHC